MCSVLHDETVTEKWGERGRLELAKVGGIEHRPFAVIVKMCEPRS